MKIVKNDGLSVLIETETKLLIWFDCQIVDNDLDFDWNKYIFNLKCSIDIAIKEYQESFDNFIKCCELATDYLRQNSLVS